MHPYRTHNCGALTEKLVGETVRVSGWIHRKRDHGNLLFVDLRDQFGITQCVVETDEPTFAAMDSARPESVVTVTGAVVARSTATINPALPTGQVEVRIAELEIQGPADELPIQVFGFWTCAGKRCTAISCCGRTSSPASAGAWWNGASRSCRPPS